MSTAGLKEQLPLLIRGVTNIPKHIRTKPTSQFQSQKNEVFLAHQMFLVWPNRIGHLLLWSTSGQGNVLEQHGDQDGLHCWVVIMFLLLSTHPELSLGDTARHRHQVLRKLVMQSSADHSNMAYSFLKPIQYFKDLKNILTSDLLIPLWGNKWKYSIMDKNTGFCLR